MSWGLSSRAGRVVLNLCSSVSKAASSVALQPALVSCVRYPRLASYKKFLMLTLCDSVSDAASSVALQIDTAQRARSSVEVWTTPASSGAGVSCHIC